MHLSRYVKVFSEAEKAEYLILFSTKNSALALVQKSTVNSIEKNRVPGVEVETLQRLGFLVEDSALEQAEMLRFLENINKQANDVHAVIVLGMDCNLACQYCFEGSLKGNHFMKEDIASTLVDFLENKMKAGGNINLNFYGGEPLLYKDMIVHISNKLVKKAQEYKVRYSFNLVTNGTLLTKKTAQQLLKLGLSNAKITLDGPAHIHDTTRPFKAGKGSFETIINNIKEIQDIVRIDIGGNFTQDNYREFPRLLDALIENGITPKTVSKVQFFPVAQAIKEFALPEFNNGCLTINEPWLTEAIPFLREEVLRRGFYTPRIQPHACPVYHKNSLVVHYDGTLYKCPGFIGVKTMNAGHISTGLVDYAKTHNLDDWKNEECLSCAYLPLCFGGCKLLQFIQTGSTNRVNCPKPFFDATLEQLVKQDIKYRAPKVKSE